MGRAALQVAESVTRERWGEYVRQLREAASQTQRQAAQAAAVSPSVWKGIELGRAPIEKYIDPVAKAIGVNAEELRARAEEIRALVENVLGVGSGEAKQERDDLEELGVRRSVRGKQSSAEPIAEKSAEPKRRRGRPRKETTLAEKDLSAKGAKKSAGKRALKARAGRGRLATQGVSKASHATRQQRTAKEAGHGTVEYVSDATIGTLYGERAEIERLHHWWQTYQRLDADRRRVVDLLMGLDAA